MLVLTRKKNESILINGNIEITILDISGAKVRIGVTAPKDVPVHRSDVRLKEAKEDRSCESQSRE